MEVLEANTYQVEVSGWDREQTFFVEKTVLEWNGDGAKHILVRNPIAPGAVIFVRLVDPTAERATFPLAYQAESVSGPDSHGVREVQLTQMQPRATAMPARGAGV